MVEIRDELRYTKTHEWARIEGNKMTIGITDHAQTELTDIVYVELPGIGDEFQANQEMAIVESVKSTSDFYCPVPGKITEVNEDLENSPEKINEEPYGKGWLAVLEMTDPSSVDQLLSADEYRKLLAEH